MVDAAKHTYTAGMDDTFIAALAPKAHKLLGTDAGSALILSVHAARRVERRMEGAKEAADKAGVVKSALSGWFLAFTVAVQYVEHGGRAEESAAVAAALEALYHADTAYHAAKEVGALKPARLSGDMVYVETTEEDRLLAAAAHQSYADILYRLENED